MHPDEIAKMVVPFKDKLLRFAYRIVGDYMEAEDVVQEVMIKIWKKKDQFMKIENKEAWCMTLTKNLAIDKTRARRIQTDSIDNYFHLRDQDMNPYATTKSKDSMKIIKELIDELPENQKIVLHLRDIEGCTYKEISEVSMFTIDQVKVYLHRARKTLREKLINIEL